MSDEAVPNLAFGSLLAIGIATAILVLYDLIRWGQSRRSTARNLSGVICLCLSVAALGFLLLPSHAPSTGAECMFYPLTEALGSKGSEEAIRALPDEIDRTSTRECDTVARERIAISSAVLVGSLTVYIVTRRKVRSSAPHS